MFDVAGSKSVKIVLIQVPDEWQLLWSGPDVPEVYLKEFCYRARAAVERIRENKQSDDYFPSGLFLLRPFCNSDLLEINTRLISFKRNKSDDTGGAIKWMLKIRLKVA